MRKGSHLIFILSRMREEAITSTSATPKDCRNHNLGWARSPSSQNVLLQDLPVSQSWDGHRADTFATTLRASRALRCRELGHQWLPVITRVPNSKPAKVRADFGESRCGIPPILPPLIKHFGAGDTPALLPSPYAAHSLYPFTHSH